MRPNASSISIVGMACQYPGSRSPEDLWNLTMRGDRTFRPIPLQRLDLRAYGGDAASADRTYVKRAALLTGWTFDRVAFGVGGELFRSVDTAHWLALDVAARALDDAGFPSGEGLPLDCTGVIVGNSLTGDRSRESSLRLRWPWAAQALGRAMTEAKVSADQAEGLLAATEEAFRAPLPVPGDETLAGALSNTIAGRICNHFDFHGTGFTVDGACASSSLAVIEASRALATCELDVALAGGVDVSLDPFELVGFARLGALAVDTMRVYDAAPSGFLPGEGCGMLVLMRTEDAEKRGLRRYADIVGWGTSSDGAGGITRPEVRGQRLAIERALAMAGEEPDAVGIIEGHGTGTAIGDSTELQALAEIRRAASKRATISSVKAIIGHTKAAAGVASMIRAVMAIQYGVRPSSTGTDSPHPLLGDPTLLEAQLVPTDWDSERRIAGVSAMGFGGINTHIVLAQANSCRQRRSSYVIPPKRSSEVVPIGASSRQRLAEIAKALVERADEASEADFRRLAETLRSRFGSPLWAERAVIVADDEKAFATEARRIADEIYASLDGKSSVQPKRICFLFPGQTAPAPTELGEYEEFAPARSVSPSSPQPHIVRACAAGVEFLSRLGIQGDVAIGHSLGEVSALSWAGVMSPDAAIELADQRGRVMTSFGRLGTGMLAIEADEAEVEALVDESGLELACRNGKCRYVLAGDNAQIESAANQLRQQSRGSVRLPVTHAFHSSAMENAREPLKAVLRDFDFEEPTKEVVSTVTGVAVAPTDNIRDVLLAQLEAPVLFTDAFAAAGQCDLYIEVGPGRVMRDILTADGIVKVTSLDIGASGKQLASTVAELWLAGAADLRGWRTQTGREPLDMDEPTTVISSLLSPTSVVTSDPAMSDVSPATPAVSHANATSNDPLGTTSPAATWPGSAPTRMSTSPDTTESVEPLNIVRQFLSNALELPQVAIAEDAGLQADLHLNSLRIAQLTAELFTQQGLAQLAQPLDAALATVADLAEMLNRPGEAGSRASGAPRHWIGVFEHDWQPVERPAFRPWPSADGNNDSLFIDLRSASAKLDDVPALIASFLGNVAKNESTPVVIIHDDWAGAAALGRSVATEYPNRKVTTVQLDSQAEFVNLPLHDSAFGEFAVTAGRLMRPITRAVLSDQPDNPAPVRPGVILVTGGATGITLPAAEELANPREHHILVLGRRPADDPATVSELANRAGTATYIECDVTNAGAIRAAMGAVSEYGPVRAIVHGAAINSPQRIATVSEESMRRTWMPKVEGVEALLSAANEEDLDVVVAFSSIIARRGLIGEAEYAIANDAMRSVLQRWARSRPGVMARTFEWTVWANRGMGESLGVLDSLRSQGMDPLAPTDGKQIFAQAMRRRNLPDTLLVSGPSPDGVGLRLTGDGSTLFRRFDDARVEVVNHVAAVVDSTLSWATDHGLADHCIDGTAVLPAVLGLEAVAQALRVAGRSDWNWRFENLRLDAPILIPEDVSRTIRVGVDRQPFGTSWHASVSDDSDQFRLQKLRVTVSGVDEATSTPKAAPNAGHLSAPFESLPLYGPLFFHSGRFRRVGRYRMLSAFDIDVELLPPTEEGWFGAFHPQDLELGDIAALDASIHAIMACAPHHRVLPISADSLEVRAPLVGAHRVVAHETAHDKDTYTFNAVVLDDAANVLAAWDGLRLRSIAEDTSRWAFGLPLALAGPLISRCVLEAGGPAVKIIAEPEVDRSKSTAGHHLLSHAESTAVSASHSYGARWLATSDCPIGIDTELYNDKSVPLADAAQQVVSEMVRLRPTEPTNLRSLRVWTAQEAMIKLGIATDTPLAIREERTETGAVISMVGPDVAILSGCLQVQDQPGPVVYAIAWRRP